MKRMFIFCGVVYLASVASADVLSRADMRDVRLQGHVGDLLSLCLLNHLADTDPLYLTKPFHSRQEASWWQTEFWGKWMHAAMPFAEYDEDSSLRRSIAAGLEDIMSTQSADGYIGNYRPERRYGHGCWDVWGTKYTLLGLLFASGDWSGLDPMLKSRALSAAERLAGCLMRTFGEVGADSFRPLDSATPLCRTGWYRGMPSCSVLEPIVLLYRRTGKNVYLDFARYIMDQMDADDGARLIKECGKPVFERITEGGLDSALKAYEMMSCYQGLLELSDVLRFGGKVTDIAVADRLLSAAVSTAGHIIAEEINIVGGAASGEHWYGGRAKQVWNYNRQNETCVLTTWMRFCEKLFMETGDSKYVDALEQCFYNAYLATMKPDGTGFSQYCPLAGTRTTGEHHCRMHTNCCNANGPRGFLCFLGSMLAAQGDTVRLNLYASGFASIAVPSLGGKVDFQVYTEYPKAGRIEIWYRSERAATFSLAPRIPAWCGHWSMEVNGKKVEGGNDSARQPRLARTWEPGDKVVLEFEMPVKAHIQDHHVAFTRGPVTLARDARWGGDIGETIRPAFAGDGSGETSMPDVAKLKLDFRQVEPEGAWMAFDAVLPVGTHSESVDGKLPRTVRFVDFASAGGTWDSRSAYRTWLPLLRFEQRR